MLLNLKFVLGIPQLILLLYLIIHNLFQTITYLFGLQKIIS